MKKALKTFYQTQIKYFHTEVWKVSLECMEYKVFSFQFKPVLAKRSCPGFSDGSDHDDPKTSLIDWVQKNRLLCKLWKDANQFRIHLLPQNSGS